MAITANLKGTAYPSFQIGKTSLGAPTIQTGTADPTVLPQPGVNGDLYIRYGSGENQLWQYVLGTWELYSQQPQIGVAYKSLDYTSGTTNIISLPANSIILSTEVEVTTAFNGTPTLDIGYAGNIGALLPNAAIDLTSVGNDAEFNAMYLSTAETIESTFVANGATTGAFTVFIVYSSTEFSVLPTNATIVADLTALEALSPVTGQFGYVLDTGGGSPGLYIWNGTSWVAVSSGGGGGAVSSVSNSDGTLTISPTTGNIIASLNLGNANNWTALQEFSGDIALNSSDYIMFNGTSDMNWRMGLGINAFSTSLVGASTSLQIVTGEGSSGPDGFAVGQTGGASIFELDGYNKTAYFAGNVGIGTTTPYNKLDVYGSVAIGTSYAGSTAAPSNSLLVESTIAVGTSSPANIGIDAAYSGGAVGTGTIRSTVPVGNAGFVLGTTSKQWSFYPASSGGGNDIALFEYTTTFNTGGNTRITFQSGGNIGIGTSTPSQLLSVNGIIQSMTGGFEFPDSTIQTTAAVSYSAGTGLTLTSTTFAIDSTVTTLTGTQTLTNKTLTAPVINQPNTTLNVEIQATNYSVASNDSGSVITNTGATGTTTYSLPAASSGLDYIFISDTAQAIVIQAAGSNTIRNGTSVTTAGGNFTSSATIGEVLRIVALNSNEWYVLHITESWTVN